MGEKKPVPAIQHFQHNPMHWPAEILPLLEEAMTCEVATLTRQGIPITTPLTPYIGDNEGTLDVSTGLTYPAKAERARRNPKVAMLYSDAVGTGLTRAPIVLIYGSASVQDRDIQANTDRYVRLSLAKSPAGFKGVPAFFLRSMAWYFARIWIQVTPQRILWWADGDTAQQPQSWVAPSDLQLPTSDPPPPGKQPPPWKTPAAHWRPNALRASQELGLPILTTVDHAGFPVPMRTIQATLTEDGFALTLPAGAPLSSSGPGCLTFHTHPQVFSGQENKAFLGKTISHEAGKVDFVVERALADWSLHGSRLQAGLEFFQNGRSVRPRLLAEAQRRGQPVPRVHIPTFW